MAWRTILIQNPAKLRLVKGQLQLENEGGKHSLPLEDIIALVLESPQISLNASLLSYAQDQGVAIITCDKSHMPNGVMLPFHAHSRQSRVAYIQQSCTKALKKRLWQRVIQAKIINQAVCLQGAGGEVKRLITLANQVKSGDPDNLEAQAARYYWTRLMGKSFKRGNNDLVNAALNYGYAIIRAYVARSQVAYGLMPTFGLHHANELNSFNLTDDLMEVLRPFVDHYVFEMQAEGLFREGESLPIECRQHLAGAGAWLCDLEGETHSLANTCDKMAAGLVCAMENNSPALLPLTEFKIGKLG
ncbi:type II CRISPR-associated endonuclease Cas1 [Paremcibacter congregatus]|uniref:CRISPR-associated endonuclease Cas1 n=1 Tax=Paremcibacter congregatus TaxID=2043170 RepID=A0A6B9RU97_9PROT|nr:type II CRISPR-associated endonuclease Cas1 [Paremcibacter congregatus]QHI06646.1 CRISPR-associated endonuclease Cas1 [Paremcibacter congregatus]